MWPGNNQPPLAIGTKVVIKVMNMQRDSIDGCQLNKAMILQADKIGTIEKVEDLFVNDPNYSFNYAYNIRFDNTSKASYSSTLGYKYSINDYWWLEDYFVVLPNIDLGGK